MSQGAATQQSSLIAYPKQAAVGRLLPKSKIYEHGGANTRRKELFVQQVEKIFWAFKLAPETLHLPERPGVPEIQVFSLLLKTPDLHQDVLRSIDGAIPFPIVFELIFENKTQVIAAYKRLNEADTSRWVLSDYFSTEWLPANSERTALPIALHLSGLYEQLLHRLIPLPARPQETLAELVARVEQAQAKQREVDKTSARLVKEKQFNRKVEINAELRRQKSELDELKIANNKFKEQK